MSSPIVFRIEEAESTFLDPRKNFEPHTQRFQVRFDPLTGRTGHFSHFGAVAAQPLDMERYGRAEVKAFCPFCPEHRQKYTPQFPDSVVRGGRAARNEALLIPNLFPYDVYSSVVIMSDEHVVPVEGLTEARLFDAFLLGLDFLKKVSDTDGSQPYHVMTWNYMPPSGGGLVHPHQQYFATATPGNQFADEFDAARRFHRDHGRDFWSLLVDEEKRIGARHIADRGTTSWLASFVSFGLLGEVLAVFPDVFTVRDCGEREIGDLVSGLLNLFGYYRRSGIGSFNASWFFGPEGQRFFPAHLRIIPRTFLNLRDYASDLSFFQALLAEPISVVLPEELTQAVRPFFQAPLQE